MMKKNLTVVPFLASCFFIGCLPAPNKGIPDVFDVSGDISDIPVSNDFQDSFQEKYDREVILDTFETSEVEGMKSDLEEENAETCEPKKEECNKVDDDCDGETDEDFDLENDKENCGTCQNNCLNLPNVFDARCEKGKCVIVLCKENYFDTNNKAEDGCECEKTSDEEICDQVDNNCNGLTDEELADCCVPQSEEQCGFNNLGECKLGKRICDETGKWGECEGALLPQDEICDGKDNDCDGKTDEGYPVGEICSVGIGGCERFGVFVCDSQDPTKVVCNVIPGEPQTELCNGIDDDCDGETDEDWLNELGKECEVGKGECKNFGKLICDPGDPTKTTCDASPLPPQEELCDGKDNDCNGLTDIDKFPQLNTTCFMGTGECLRQGVFICDTNPDSPTFGYAKCSVEAGLPAEEICDNKDNDCDGITDNVAPEKLISDDNNCGECFNKCTLKTNSTKVGCQNSKCVIVECIYDPNPFLRYYDADKIYENGCECQISSNAVEICDGKDNDCDGQTDEYCDNLVLYLPFDGDWQDKSKYDNNATPYDGAGFTSDAIIGQAASFDGVDDYAVVNHSTSLGTLTEEFTYFIIVKVTSLKKTAIFDKFELRPSITIEPCGNDYCFFFYLNGKLVENQKVVMLNTWYKIALRYNKGQVNIYFEGELYWQGNTDYPHNPGLNKIYLAKRGGYLQGAIDESIFYNKACSDLEIKDYYQKIKQ